MQIEKNLTIRQNQKFIHYYSITIHQFIGLFYLEWSRKSCFMSSFLKHQTWSKCHHQMSDCNKNYICLGWFLGVSSFSLSLNLNLHNIICPYKGTIRHLWEEVTQESMRRIDVSSSSGVCWVKTDVKWFRVTSNSCLFQRHERHVKHIK